MYKSLYRLYYYKLQFIMYDNAILMVLHLECSVLNILTMTKISELKNKKYEKKMNK